MLLTVGVSIDPASLTLIDSLCFIFSTVGVSTDPASVTMIDSVKVYVKTKEAFGWPEDLDEATQDSGSTSTSQKVSAPPTQTVTSSGAGGSMSRSGFVNQESDMALLSPLPMTPVDRLVY